MSEVRTFVSGESPHSDVMVLKSDYDAAQSELAALREELATAKRNERNSEVAYKASIERQEELRKDLDWNRLCRSTSEGEWMDALNASEQRLADAERRNAVRDIESAAKVLANCMDYPWEHMPENGRALMRKHAKDVIDAALNPKPSTPSQEAAKRALSFDNQRIQPARFHCIACGEYHEGSGNLPCPKMSPMSGGRKP